MLRASNLSLVRSGREVLDVIKCAMPMPLQLQSVRLRKEPKRKPFFLGTARSKLFRFPVHKPYAPGEHEELKKLFNDYRHDMKSIINYFKEEFAKTSDTSVAAAKLQKAEEENHTCLMEENRLENERIVKMRDARLTEELKVKRETLLEKIMKHEEEQRLRIQKADELVRQEMERSKSFVTLETLNDAIEKALETETDYNFALDHQGNVYKGRRATVPPASRS